MLRDAIIALIRERLWLSGKRASSVTLQRGKREQKEGRTTLRDSKTPDQSCQSIQLQVQLGFFSPNDTHLKQLFQGNISLYSIKSFSAGTAAYSTSNQWRCGVGFGDAARWHAALQGLLEVRAVRTEVPQRCLAHCSVPCSCGCLAVSNQGASSSNVKGSLCTLIASICNAGPGPLAY